MPTRRDLTSRRISRAFPRQVYPRPLYHLNISHGCVIGARPGLKTRRRVDAERTKGDAPLSRARGKPESIDSFCPRADHPRVRSPFSLSLSLSLSVCLSVQVHAYGCVRRAPSRPLAYKCNTPPGRYITRIAHAASDRARIYAANERAIFQRVRAMNGRLRRARFYVHERATLRSQRLVFSFLSVCPSLSSPFCRSLVAPRRRFCGRLAPSFGSVRFPPEDKKGTRAP